MSTQHTQTGSAPGWAYWSRPDVLASLGLTVVMLPASIGVLSQQRATIGPAETAVLALLCTVVLGSPLLAARHPLAGFAMATGAMAALALLPVAISVSAALYPSGVGYLLCLGQLAARSSWTWTLAGWASGVFGAALIALTAPELTAADPAGTGLRLGAFAGLAAAVTAAAAVGMLQRARRIRAEERSQAGLRQAVAEERMRISRDLHDVIAHSMTVMIAQADAARAVLRDDPDLADRALGTVVTTGRAALHDMRAVVRAEPDAVRSPAPTIDDLPALVDAVRSPVCEAEFEEHGTRRPLAAPVVLALHRAVREGLANAVRHTRHPVRIVVRLEWSDAEVRATVSDDGGAGAATAGLGTGTGLTGLAERVESVGGTLSAAPLEPRGWALTVRLPAGKER